MSGILPRCVTLMGLLSGLQIVEVRLELEAKYSSELQREKSHMAKEIKDVTVLLLKQGEEQLQRAQER